MTVTIVGSQLGDEGKGALVDLWGGGADAVARYQGVEVGVGFGVLLDPVEHPVVGHDHVRAAGHPNVGVDAART